VEREDGARFRKLTHLGRENADGYGMSEAAATTSKGGGGIVSEREEGGKWAGRQSGKGSQPRFADAKDDRKLRPQLAETTINYLECRQLQTITT
jgi:hypothetical protein